MSEIANNNDVEINVEDLQEQLKQKDAQLEDLKNQFVSVKSKADELLGEKKSWQSKYNELASNKQTDNKKSSKNDDYEQLMQSMQQKLEERTKQLEELQTNVTKEKITNTALKVASELADGANAEILSEFIARRLKYTEDGITVTDEKGNLTVSTLDDLKKEFNSSEKYKSLLRGTKASGGGAQGAGDGVAKSKTMKRADFEKLNPLEKAKFFKDGGALTDS